MKDVFHQGELEIQRRAGEAELAAGNQGMVTSTIVKGAINFIEKQAMAIASTDITRKSPAGEDSVSLTPQEKKVGEFYVREIQVMIDKRQEN